MKVTKTMVTEISEDLVSQDPNLTWEDAPSVHAAVKYALEKAAEKWERTEKIWAVYSEGGPDQWNLVGLATGQVGDIEARFDDGGKIDLLPCDIINVPSGYRAKRNNMIAKRDRLKAEMEDLDRRLQEGDVL